MQYIPYIPIVLISGFVSLMLAVFMLQKQREERSVRPVIVLMLAISLWIFAYAGELILLELEAKILLAKISYLGIVTIPTSFFIFTLEYTNPPTWLNTQKRYLLLIMPVFTLLMVFFNDFHMLHWADVRLIRANEYQIAVFDYGILFWLHTAYSYILLLVATILIVRAFIKTKPIYRHQVRLILLSVFFPWVANIIYLTDIRFFPSYLDITPFSFLLTGLVVSWAVWQSQLMDLIPISQALLMDYLDDLVVVVNKDGRIIDTNQSFDDFVRLEQHQGKILGSDFMTLFQSIVRTPTPLPTINQTGAKQSDEITFSYQDTTYFFQMHQYPVHNRYNELSAILIVLQDMTDITATHQELTVAREQATESVRLKSQFMATMTHELRTPMNSLLGFLQLLQENPDLSDEERAAYLQTMSISGQHLLRLINDVLEINRMEANQASEVIRDCDLHDMLDQLGAFFKESANLQQLDFKIIIEDDIPRIIRVDELRLRQILINLLGNALKFTVEGFVHLHVSLRGNILSFAVKDSGVGIPPEDLADLFTPFYQGSDTSKHHQGTGLGLAISQQFAKLMNGMITVDSLINRGATFTLDIPYISSDSSEITTKPVIDLHRYDPSTETKSPIKMANIGHITEENRNELRASTIALSPERAYYAIDKIELEDEILAGQLKRLVDDFRFDVLLKLTE